MADQQLDVFGGEDEEERLWEALSSFKKLVRGLVEMTGLSTNELADTYGFGKGKVSTWQNAKREQPNIPPLQFVEALIEEARKHANLQDGAAAVFLRQYGELLQLYCARANPHNVHRQMLIDYQNTLLIRELNNATNAALKQIVELTEELETLRGDRDEERRHRIALEQQIDSLKSQNQDRAAEKKTALAKLDRIRPDLTAYKRDQQLEKQQPDPEQDGSHTNQPHPPAPAPLPPPPGRDTKRRRRLVLSLIAVGVVVVSLAVYAGTQLPGDQNDHKGNADGKPDQTSTHKPSTGGSASPGRSPHTSVTATPHQTAGSSSTASGGSTGGGSSNGGSSSNSSGAGTDPTKGAASGSGDAGGSHGSNGSSGASNPATPPASSGRFRLRDVGYGKCLAVSYSVVFDTCADTPATNWTAKAGSDGSYVLYNESADQCLNVNRNLLSMADCGSSRQNWRTGTSSTVVNLDSSLCLEERSGWPVVGSCEPSKSTQHWAKE
ncbi:ricin-type beta-trefoil lectin domain protein [Streptomyces sp. NPDC046631]|uniref:ricin-type beta-trefoil lectin domain protein n=1 Tax=unclassified Streptomyces TaxID=2593676 RepID=UPI0033F11226